MTRNEMSPYSSHILAFVMVMVTFAFVSVGAQITSTPPDRACLCSTMDVHGRSEGSLSGKIRDALSKGKCGRFIGGTEKGDGYTWYRLVFDGKTLWVAGNFLRASGASCCDFSVHGCPTIINRVAWGARSPRSSSNLTGNQPLEYAFIHHSASATCTSRASCASSVRAIQNRHMDVEHWSDIGYSFVIGGDGSIFEGRGWDRAGAHTLGYNDVGLGFGLIGNFDDDKPTDVQIQATQMLLSYGIFLHKLSANYKLRGHKDVGDTSCPGRNLYKRIQTWPHYSAPPGNGIGCGCTASAISAFAAILVFIAISNELY